MAQIYAQPVLAQAAGASGAGAELDAIIVTARKTSENIIDTPIAIMAMSSESLAKKNVISIQGMQDFTPGFRISQTSFGRNDRGYSTYSMRGIYGGDSQARQPVRVFIDGVPIASGMVAGLDAIERVEVVSGPQSAYFGRATFAGAVNFITRTPDFELGGAGSAEVGTHGYGEVKAHVEGPIVGDVVSARLSARYYTYGGSYQNAGGVGKVGAQESKSISGTLFAKPTENLRLKAFGQYWRDEDGAPAQGILNAQYYNCNPAGGVARTYTCGRIDSVPPSILYVRNTFAPAIFQAITAENIGHDTVPANMLDHMGLARRAYQGFVTFEYDLPGSWTVSGNLGGGDNKYLIALDGYNQPQVANFLQTAGVHLYDYSGEVRLQSPMFMDRLKFMVGVNYLNGGQETFATGYRGSTAAVTAAITNATEPARLDSRTTGFFASAHLAITDKLKLDLEGRNQQDHIAHKVMPNANSLAGQTAIAAQKTFTTFTPKISLSYDVSPDVMVYASYSEGSRPGQFNVTVFGLAPAARAALLAQTGVQLAVPPEKLKMYELGLKGEFFDRRMRVLASTYYGDWTDRQVTAQIFYQPAGAPSSLFVSAISGGSKVKLYGVEAKMEYRLSQALTLEGTFAYNQSDIRATACAACLALTGNASPVGTRLPGYPALTGSASVNYTRDLTDDIVGYAGLDYVFTGKMYDSEANLAWTADAHRFNVRMGATRGRYTAEAFGKNIFNDKTPTSVFRVANTAQGGNALVVSPPEKPLFGVRLSAKY